MTSNSVFTMILLGLEKMVELEFQCPCKPNLNRSFSLLFFIIPAFLAFMLMLISQRCDCCGIFKSCGSCGSCKSNDISECCDCYGCLKRVCFSVVPAVVWLILVFLDGQYFVCAMTDWEGKFVSMDTENPKKWCEPVKEDKTRNSTTQELMMITQEFFFTSQVRDVM